MFSFFPNSVVLSRDIKKLTHTHTYTFCVKEHDQWFSMVCIEGFITNHEPRANRPKPIQLVPLAKLATSLSLSLSLSNLSLFLV